jgi:hypothetical protein
MEMDDNPLRETEDDGERPPRDIDIGVEVACFAQDDEPEHKGRKPEAERQEEDTRTRLTPGEYVAKPVFWTAFRHVFLVIGHPYEGLDG